MRERWELEGSLWPYAGYFPLQYNVQGLLSWPCSVTDCHPYTWQMRNLKTSNCGILDVSFFTGSAFMLSLSSFQKTSRPHLCHLCLDTVSWQHHILKFYSPVFRNKQCPWLVHRILFWRFYFTILVYFCFETSDQFPFETCVSGCWPLTICCLLQCLSWHFMILLYLKKWHWMRNFQMR